MWRSRRRSVVLLFCLTGTAGSGTDEGLAALAAGDFSKARDEFRKSAEAGDPEGAFQLAELYRKGAGVTKTPRLAAQWYEKAVLGGHADGAGRLGAMLWAGNGVPADRERALALLRKGVQAGSATAQYRLALLHYKGESVGLTSKESLNLFRQAATQGHAGAQTRYGAALHHGPEDGKKDPDAAAEWFRKAAEQGHVEGAKRLASYLIDRKEYVEAVKWKKQAALHGDGGAQSGLSSLCFLAEMPAEAYAWHLVASDHRNSRQSSTRPAERLRRNMAKDEKGRRKEVEGRLRPEERREGKKRAQEYAKAIRASLKQD